MIYVVYFFVRGVGSEIECVEITEPRIFTILAIRFQGRSNSISKKPSSSGWSLLGGGQTSKLK